MLTTVDCLKVGEMATNCYIITDEKSRKCVIVDPADDIEYIKDFINRNSLKPELILATHGHSDHVSLLFELKLTFNSRIGFPQKDLFIIRNSCKYNESLNIFSKTENFKSDINFDSDNQISFAQSSIYVITSPGHTPGSVCFHTDVGLFVGDLFFSDGSLGEIHRSYSNKGLLIKSLNKIFKLNPRLNVFPGHGESGTLGTIKSMITLNYEVGR